MRTKTLLLLAVACGLVILAAGVVQLLRVAAQDDPARAAAVGDVVAVGDLTVTVLAFAERDGRGVVSVEVGGVDDPDGIDEFRLVVPGAALPPTTGAAACAGTTVTAQRCDLVFGLPQAPGTSRVLLYRRGDEQVRWELVGG
ncbi:MAG: hypothetical protein M3487_01655 [Actinomycetota bacterium]|nr:hypothetical protein [Actinomycetota bacterium]